MPERKTKYSTASENGMQFICNRWVYAGDKGYKVRPNGDGTYSVLSYAHTDERPTYGGMNLTEDEAHEMAARLAGTTPHPKVG